MDLASDTDKSYVESETSHQLFLPDNFSAAPPPFFGGAGGGRQQGGGAASASFIRWSRSHPQRKEDRTEKTGQLGKTSSAAVIPSLRHRENINFPTHYQIKLSQGKQNKNKLAQPK